MNNLCDANIALNSVDSESDDLAFATDDRDRVSLKFVQASLGLGVAPARAKIQHLRSLRGARMRNQGE